MSIKDGARYEITDDGHLTIAIKHGANTLYIDELEDEFAVGAIRQQARDLDQLRADLAAAVAERDRLLRNEAGLLNSLKDSHNARFRLEARLAAIEAAPVVHCAWVVINGVNTYAQLIARPAKD